MRGREKACRACASVACASVARPAAGARCLRGAPPSPTRSTPLLPNPPVTTQKSVLVSNASSIWMMFSCRRPRRICIVLFVGFCFVLLVFVLFVGFLFV